MTALLTKCGACENDLSVKAAACPKCGHPNALAPKSIDAKALLEKVMNFKIGIKGIVALLVGFIIIAKFTARPAPAEVAAAQENYEAAPPPAAHQAPQRTAPEQRSNPQQRIIGMFGPKPEQSEKNGPYREVSDYLRQASRDPASLEIESCSKVQLDEKVGWLVGCAFKTADGQGTVAKYANWFVIRGQKVVKLLGQNAYKIE